VNVKVAVMAALSAAVGLSVVSAANAGGTSLRATAIPLLRVGATETFSTLDPAKNAATGGTYDILEGLFGTYPDSQTKPELATSVSRPGADVYVYHLRHGVRFWDGSEMTSADVVNSLNYERYPRFVTAESFKYVKSITAAGRYAVVVTLKQRDASWGLGGCCGAVFEKRFADAHRATMGNPGVLIMGTGPWEPVSFDPTSGLELKANPHWWGGQVPVQHISVKFFADENSEALAFRAGDIDVAFPMDARAFASESGAKLAVVPSGWESYLGMSTDVAPWNDIHVRRAVAYAIDRSAVIGAHGGYASPATTFLTLTELRASGTKTAIATMMQSLPRYPLSLAKARAELAKSAYPHGFKGIFEAPTFADRVQLAEVIAAPLAKIGIDLQVTPVSLAKWLDDITGPNKNKIGINYVELDGSSPDPASQVDAFLTSTAPVNWGYHSRLVESLAAEGHTVQGAAKRFQIYAQIERRVDLDLPYIPIFNPDVSLALSPHFTLPSFNSNQTYGSDFALYIKPKR
jgi:peptide/nickel transport system substrate-binding protein